MRQGVHEVALSEMAEQAAEAHDEADRLACESARSSSVTASATSVRGPP